MAQHPRFGFAIEYVDDIEAAKRFYVDVVGLKVERTHPTFVQFPNFAIASDQSLSLDGRRDTELYWLVDDADSAFSELSQKAEVTLPVRQMPFGKVFGIKGAAGEPRYLLELAKNRPSQRAE
jgi:catechol 2,3-dioxygenase-like lactoylglutathione lyase family enzyme